MTRTIRRGLAALGCLAFVCTATTARAQTPASSPWAGYAPQQAWAYQAPATVMVRPDAPVLVSAPPGWTGYAPARAWSGYAPAVTQPWGTYSYSIRSRPNLAWSTQNPGPNPYADGRPYSYREFGTGRSVSLAKPWLPGSR